MTDRAGLPAVVPVLAAASVESIRRFGTGGRPMRRRRCRSMANPLHSRRLFMGLSRLMAPGIRHGVVRSTRVGGRLCVLRTRGRRSGKVREAALDYAEAPDGGILVAAGWGRATAWYLNLLSDPHVSVTCEGRTRAGEASTITDPLERLRAIRAILVASGFVARLYGYDPRTVPDARLASDFATTPVVHVTFDADLAAR